MNFMNDVSPEILHKSLENREFIIDWKSLKLFQYHNEIKPTVLDGRSKCGTLRARIANISKTGRSERPFVVFYKQKKNNIRIEEAYYLSDDEVELFNSKFQVKH